MNNLKKLLSILFLLLYGVTYAQQHEWATPMNPIAPGEVSPFAVVTDSSNNHYLGGMHTQSFTLGNDTVNHNGNGSNLFVAKVNDSGKLIWVKTWYFQAVNHIHHSSFFFNRIELISDNRILATGLFRGKSLTDIILRLTPTDSIINTGVSSFDMTAFYVLYDSLGNIVKYGKICEGDMSAIALSENTALDTQNNIYIGLFIRNATVYSDKRSIVINYGSNMVWLVAKFTPEFDSLIWSKQIISYKSDDSANVQISSIQTGQDNNLYLGANVLKNGNPKGVLLVLSPSGSLIHEGFINADTTQQDRIANVAAIDTGRIYVLGYVQDSLLYGGQWFTLHDNFSGHFGRSYMAQVSITKAGWVSLSNVTGMAYPANNIIAGSIPARVRLSKNSDYVYASFHFPTQSGVLSMGGLTDSISKFIQSCFVKFDTLGNVLWLRYGDIRANDMQLDKYDNLIYCGDYANYGTDTLFLPPLLCLISNINLVL